MNIKDTFVKYIEEAIGHENALVAFSAFEQSASTAVRYNPFKPAVKMEGREVPWAEAHIGINHTVEIHILQRIYILNLTQVEFTLSRRLEIGVADRCLHICCHTERIASKREIKGVNHNSCCIQATTRILNHSGNIDTINTC